MTKEEKWVALSRFDNLLEVSDQGRVRTKGRTYKTWRGGDAVIKGRVLKPRRHPWDTCGWSSC